MMDLETLPREELIWRVKALEQTLQRVNEKYYEELQRGYAYPKIESLYGVSGRGIPASPISSMAFARLTFTPKQYTIQYPLIAVEAFSDERMRYQSETAAQQAVRAVVGDFTEALKKAREEALHPPQ